MKKALLITGVVVVLLVGGVLTAWWWLTHTRSGAEFALNRTAGAVPSLQWEQLDGGLARGLVLSGVRLDEADTRIDIDRLELAARISLLPLAVDVHWLRVRDVDVYLPPPDPEAPEPPPFEMPEIGSPLPIRIHELLAERVRLHLPSPPDGPPADPLTVERVYASATWHERLDLDTLELTGLDFDLAARGHWELAEPFAGELELEADYAIDDQTRDVQTRQQLQARLSGRLDALDIEFEGTGPANVSGRARVEELLQDLRLELELAGHFGDWPDLEFSATDLEVSARGDLNAWAAQISGRLQGPEIPQNHLQAELAGSMTEIQLEHFLAEVFDGQIEARGQVRLDPDLAAEGVLEFDRLDLTELYPEWPEQARIEGSVLVAAEAGSVRLQELSLRAPPTSLSLTGSGAFDPERDLIALDLSWQDLAWPPVTDDTEPLLASQSGTVRLTGTLSDWQVELEAILQALEMPPTRIDARARGDEQRADIERLMLDAGPAGRLDASGQVRWTPEPGGALELALAGVQPDQFVAELPGQVDARLDLRFETLTDLAVDLHSISGRLRNQPLDGRGRVVISQERPESGELRVALGDNQLHVTSDDGEDWHWQLDAEALQQLWPGLSGTAGIEGRFNPFERIATLSGRVHSAGYEEINVERVELDMEAGWQEVARAEIGLQIIALDLNPWERIEQADLSFSGDCDGHRLALSLFAERGNLDLAGRGALPDCLEGGRTWRGAIERLTLTNTVAGNWELNRPLALTAGSGEITAEAGCLVESATRDGRICLRSLAVGDVGRIEIGIEAVPMDLLLLPMDPPFHLTNALSGELAAGWTERGLDHLGGHLALGSGVLQPLDTDRQLLVINAVRLDLASPEDDPSQLLATLEATLEGDSRLYGQARLHDLTDPGTASVDAEARLRLPDIGVFNRLVAELDRLDGELEVDLRVHGELPSPTVEGQARLNEGVVAHAPLGLTVERIELLLDVDNDHGRLGGRMYSGGGQMQVDGRLRQIDNGWRYEVELDGDDFEFANIEWLSLRASPQIQMHSEGEVIHLDGDIRINRLRAGMPPGAEERVTESEDVRVIGEEDQVDEDLIQQLAGRMAIHMGDDARISAMGLQTQLTGAIELLWDPQTPMPRGRGQILLRNGSYSAYGQNLEVRNGEILFTGHALDNPRLDIRAVRDIFGDPQVDEAGLHIRGNAQSPIITLFTDPPTSEEKALAYVVTGADFDVAGGHGAVSLGFYLLPRLFVSYGIGLFEAGNVLSGRYELSRRWGIRVVSGERDTGVDLSFAIDR